MAVRCLPHAPRLRSAPPAPAQRTAPAARRASGPLLLLPAILLVVAACGSGLVTSGAPASDSQAPATQDEVRPLSKLAPDSVALGTTAGSEASLLGDDIAQEAGSAGAGSNALDGALIIRWGSLEMEVPDVALALAEARREIGALGGYVAGSDESDQGEHRWASVTYRVPVAHFDGALQALRGLSERVVREATQSQEVTAQVVDLDARITNLRASEGALVEIMSRAGRIDDVLAVQLRLEEVRGQIERLVAQRDGLADQAALATISTTWYTPVAAVQAAQEAWDLATEVDAALAQTVAALQGAAGFAVWLAVVALPLLGIPLLVLAAAVLVLRRRILGRAPGSPGDAPAVGGSPAE